MRFDEILTFLAVARSGGLVGAAETLGINHSTVYRRLESFETRIGAKLFVRGTSSYVLTPVGERAIGRAETIEREMRELERALHADDGEPFGRLVLTTPEAALPLVTPALAEFRTRYPKVALTGVFEDRFLDLTKREADVAIRFSEKAPSHLIARDVGAVAWGVFHAGEGPADDMPWASYGDAMKHIPQARWRRDTYGDDGVTMRVNSVPAMSAVIAGGGCRGLLPCFVGKTSGLTMFGPQVPVGNARLWVLYHPDMRRSQRVRLLVDHLAEALAVHADALAGCSRA